MDSTHGGNRTEQDRPLSRPFADAKGHTPSPFGLRRAGPLPQGERAKREHIVAAARAWIGTPYRHQASLKGVGCDCLGLLIGVWRAVTGETVGPLPPYTPDWAEAARRETLAEGLREYLDEIDPSDARAGDIVLFRWRAHLPAKHAGILISPDRMVHAQQGARVAEVPVSGWWRRRMAFGFGYHKKRQISLKWRTQRPM